MEESFENQLVNDVARNTRAIETNASDSALKEYNDILVWLYGLPMKNINKNLLLPNENVETK